MARPARRPRRRVIVNKRIAPYLFLLPFIVLFVVFLIVPLIYAFDLSVYQLGAGRRAPASSGSTITGAPSPTRNFWAGVLVLVKFGLMQIPVMLALALFFALILDSGVTYAKSFFRISFLHPLRGARGDRDAALGLHVRARLRAVLAAGAPPSAGPSRTSSPTPPSFPRSPTSRPGNTWATT